MTRIADLPNLGPKSQQMLERAGIETVEHLRELGAVRAYLQVKRNGGNASLNLLWAMEGALTGQHWQAIAKNERLRLLLELEEAGRKITGFSPEERTKMLAVKGVGETVISRLEQIGFSALSQLVEEDAASLTKQISQMMGSTCWHNSPQARSAIQGIITLAQKTGTMS